MIFIAGCVKNLLYHFSSCEPLTYLAHDQFILVC